MTIHLRTLVLLVAMLLGSVVYVACGDDSGGPITDGGTEPDDASMSGS